MTIRLHRANAPACPSAQSAARTGDGGWLHRVPPAPWRGRRRGQAPRMRSFSGLGELTAIGDDLLLRAPRRGSALCLALFEFAQLQQVRELRGPETHRRLMKRIAQALAGLASSRGRFGRVATSQFAVLLPGFDQEQARQAIADALGTPARVELDPGTDGLVLAVHCRLGCIEQGAGDSTLDLYRRLFAPAPAALEPTCDETAVVLHPDRAIAQ